MAAYDKWSWHVGGDFPDGVPEENGATHIGMFLAWAIHRGLEGELHQRESAIEVAMLRAREMTGREFLINVCDGKLISEDLDDEGNAFAEAYYDRYLGDYSDAVDASSLESSYHVADNIESFEKVAALLDRRFDEWKTGALVVKSASPSSRSWWRFWST